MCEETRAPRSCTTMTTPDDPPPRPRDAKTNGRTALTKKKPTNHYDPAKEASKPQWKKPKKPKDKKPEDKKPKGKKPEVKGPVLTIFISSSDEDEPMAGSSSGV